MKILRHIQIGIHLPYIEEYLFSSDWKIKNFIRGTLRLNGWSHAWKNIFALLENQSEAI